MAVTTLNVSYVIAAQTIYAVIRQVDSPYSVWNGTALEVWSNANIANYDIPLTDQGGDMYAAAVPTTLPVDDYSISYYLQAGGSPAITDTQVGRVVLQWNGAALVPPTTTIVLSPYALTTLASVKTNMGITGTDDDEKLTFLINSVTDDIEGTTNRQFVAREYRSRLNGVFQRKLILPNPPLLKVYRICWGVGTAMTLGYAGTNISVSASVYQTPGGDVNGGLFIRAISSLGVTTDRDFTFAAYPTTALLAAAVAAVSGFTATAAINIPSVWLDPIVLPNLMGGPSLVTYPSVQWTHPYIVDYDRGFITFDNRAYNYYWSTAPNTGWPQWDTLMPKGDQGLIVQYRAGFETIPANLQQIANEMVKESFYLSETDTTMESERIGDYSYKRADLINGSTVADRLSQYMDRIGTMGGVSP